MRNEKLLAMIEAAIFAAFALILDLLLSFKLGPSISIKFAMVPIFIVAFRYGFKASVLSGFLWGILQIIVGDAWIVHPVQVILEYFIAFACIGFAGLLIHPIQANVKNQQKGKAIFYMTTAVFFGGAVRYFWHFIAGMIFFKSYAFNAGKTPFIFSLTANGIAYFFSSLACVIVLVLLISIAPQIITTAKNQRATTSIGK